MQLCGTAGVVGASVVWLACCTTGLGVACRQLSTVVAGLNACPD